MNNNDLEGYSDMKGIYVIIWPVSKEALLRYLWQNNSPISYNQYMVLKFRPAEYLIGKPDQIQQLFCLHENILMVLFLYYQDAWAMGSCMGNKHIRLLG